MFPRVFHTDFRSWLAAHPSERAAFDRAMARGTAQRVEQLAALDWRGDETVVDVGGGNGSLLRGLLGRHEGLRAIVLDLPETVREEEDFDGRCSFVAGSFFVSVPHGDTYVLSTILHDWNDESAARILRAIRSSASAGARLLALDAVIPEGNEPHGAKWLDLLMLSLFAGRERDEAQWRAVLEANGFSEPVAVSDGLVEARCR